ncbi:ATP-binding protein [Synoicihabitans lomoniglobus]|uniref:histidine kinase n=1 Tax=Synoicihabitans lomoniglobus TaxID=2909285 RepID=A0AAE9ZS33_9BACT|nr:ATP-binding protein [Opitutaceae bacterium LMO-M01]WED63211.1 ATP-binding protein [Opitutaceae bacterium LMO-M01]
MSGFIYNRLKSRLRNAPLRSKLTFTVQLTGIGTILFAGISLFAYQAYQLREQFSFELSTLTRMLANYSVAPVSFEDTRGMTDVLSGLASREDVRFAALRDTSGKVLAQIGETTLDLADSSATSGAIFDGWWVICREPLVPHDETEPIGELVIGASFQPLFFDALLKFIPALLVLAGLCAIGMVVLTRVSVRIVLGGLDQLSASVSRIASTSDYNVRAAVFSEDEVGQLTTTFNGMLDKLQTSDQEIRASNHSLATEITERKRLERALVESSRLAGMAEVATSVLHNVGNVLNSVNVSTLLLRDRLESSKLKSLQRTTELMAPHLDEPGPFFSSDPRGRLVPKFITEITRELAKERSDLLTEIQSLVGNVEHIKEIVTTQQSYSRTAGVSEKINPQELIEDAIRINQPSMDRHSVTVSREEVSDVTLLADRHKVLQILVNLVSNAVHAVKQGELEFRRFEIRMTVEDDTLSIVVRDHGVGIKPEDLTRIFRHGFTTRPDGHGFGLHSGAIAARELGGSLDVASDGLGQGASFTLTIPLVTPPPTPVRLTNSPFSARP